MDNIGIPESTQMNGNAITRGIWYDVYNNNVYHDPKQLDIDHVVPLQEVYVSGGYMWDQAQKRRYYNWLETSDELMAVSLSSNRSKGSKDPARWMPKYNKCWYLTRWVKIKYTWGLTMDEAERNFIFNFLEDSCSCR